MYQESLQSLVKLVPESADRFTAHFYVDPSWELFKGHFPGFPLLPAVLQLEMTVRACERFLDFPCRLVRVVKAKFSRKVLPGDTLDMETRITRNNDLIEAKTVLHVLGEVVSSSLLILAREASTVADANRESGRSKP